MKTGTVYLVGAGCGAADLITVRGMELLRRCDVLVYDDLIAPELLEAVLPTAERFTWESAAAPTPRLRRRLPPA